jgi:hypothetical protein
MTVGDLVVGSCNSWDDVGPGHNEIAFPHEREDVWPVSYHPRGSAQ